METCRISLCFILRRRDELCGSNPAPGFRFALPKPAAFLLLLCACLLLQPAVSDDSPLVETRDGQMRVLASDIDLRVLLPQVAEQGGFGLWISEALPEQKVSADIEMMPMAEALAELLADNSFALVRGPDGEVLMLHVLPRGTAAPTSAALDAETTNMRERILQDALASQAIPDQIKAAMLNQYHNLNDETLRRDLHQQQPVAIQNLIEHLQQIGAANSETMQRLRELQLQKQAEQLQQ